MIDEKKIQAVQVAYASIEGYRLLNEKPGTSSNQLATLSALTSVQSAIVDLQTSVDYLSSITPATTPLVSDVLTSGISLPCNLLSAGVVAFQMSASSLVGHSAVFEASIDSTDGIDGVWFSTEVKRTNASTTETSTGVLAATPAYAWLLNCSAYKYARVRCTAHVSGTATWSVKPGLI